MSGPVLLVHDDIGTIAAVRRVLTRAGHEVVLATSAADAMIAFGHHLPSLIVLGPAVESGRGPEVLEELSQHPNGAETRVLLLGEEVAGYAYPVVPLPLDGASFLELFESALQAPAYTQAPPPATPSLEDTLFGDLPVEPQSTEERAHAAVEFALEQAHQEFEAEAVADLDASLARAETPEGAEPEWDPFGGSGTESGGAFESPPADGDDELAALENDVREEAARRRQARLSLQQVAQLGEESAPADAEPAPLPVSDPDLDFGDMPSGEPSAPSFAPPVVDAVALEEEQTRARRAALLQAQREAKEARIRLAELREERAGDGASIQLESDALLHQKQKEWAEREERIRRYETQRQESLKQAMAEAEAARELSAQVGLRAEEAEAAFAEAGDGAGGTESQSFDELSDPELAEEAAAPPQVGSFADAAGEPDASGEPGSEAPENEASFADAANEPDAFGEPGSEAPENEPSFADAANEPEAFGESGAEAPENEASFADAANEPEAFGESGAEAPENEASFADAANEPEAFGEAGAEAPENEASFADAANEPEAFGEPGSEAPENEASFADAGNEPDAFRESGAEQAGNEASFADAANEPDAFREPGSEAPENEAPFADAANEPDAFGEPGSEAPESEAPFADAAGETSAEIGEPQQPDEQAISFADAGGEPEPEPDPVGESASFVGSEAEPDPVGESTSFVGSEAEPDPVGESASFVGSGAEPDPVGESASFAEADSELDLVGESAPVAEAETELDLVGESAPVAEAETELDLVGESAPVAEAETELDLVGESSSFAEAETELDLVGESSSFSEVDPELDLVGESASFAEADPELELVGDSTSFAGTDSEADPVGDSASFLQTALEPDPVGGADLSTGADQQAGTLEPAAEEAHHRAALEIGAAIAEEVQSSSELNDWAEAEPDDGSMDLTGQDSAIGPDDFQTQRASAEALAVTQAQAVEQEEVAAARAEQLFQTVSARGQVASAAAARALAMAREAQQEAEDEARRQAAAAHREREEEAEAKRQLVEQTRRTVELEAQAQREREERERIAAELLAQAQRERQERDRLAEELRAQAQREREERERIAAELHAQTEREKQERLRLEAEAEARATREREEGLRLVREQEAAARAAQAEKERLAEELRLREESARLERETRDQEARILAEHARQEREVRERLEQQLQTQREQERVERERVAQELEAAREAARVSEEKARSALLQVDEEKHGREESEQNRRHAEADAEQARAEAREMAARAEAALVAIPKERGIIDRVPRTGIAPLEKLAELIRELTSARVDVRLELKADDALRVLWLRAGGIAGALSTAAGETLLDRARQDGLIDPTQLRKLSPYKDRPASDQLSVLRENGLLRESEVIPLVQRYTEAVALAAFSEAGSLYRLATEAIPADVPLAASTRPVIHLLAEGLRRGADPASVLSTLGGLRAIPVRKRSELEPGRLELSERERRLLESVDGVATIESLLLGSGVRQDTALRVLVVARALGMLELMPASESSPSEPLPELEVQRLNAKLSEIRDADYFTVLGVPRSAGKDEVLRAYELLSTEFHPLRFSTHPDPGVPRRAEELLSFLSEAVTALGDDRLRGQYARNLAD